MKFKMYPYDKNGDLIDELDLVILNIPEICCGIKTNIIVKDPRDNDVIMESCNDHMGKHNWYNLWVNFKNRIWNNQSISMGSICNSCGEHNKYAEGKDYKCYTCRVFNKKIWG